MGLIVSVYRNAEGFDGTANGITSRYNKLCLVNVSGPSDPHKHTDAAPALLIAGALPGIVRIVPAVWVPHTRIGMVITVGGVVEQESSGVLGDWVQAPGWCMMGGNYAATSDSRLGEAVERITGKRWYGAVAVHDRYEG